MLIGFLVSCALVWSSSGAAIDSQPNPDEGRVGAAGVLLHATPTADVGTAMPRNASPTR